MTPQELTIAFLKRIKKKRYWILCASLLGAVILVILASTTPATYTSTSTIFPLTGSSDNSSASSALSALFSGGDNNKNFSDEASVNIIELALSRTTCEEVAAMKDSASGNKTIAELLIEDINNHRGLLVSKITIPRDSLTLVTRAGKILKSHITATINKNNSFVLSYRGFNPELVRTVSYGFIQKISSFYIDLKREKARRDFEFASGKVDSLRGVLNTKDRQLISIDKRTLFTNTDKMEFRVPTENLITDKQMLRQQYAVAVANQQNAAYKLQKATPVIKVLDKPEPPYDREKKSSLIYGIFGFLLGLILAVLCSSMRLLVSYGKDEINKALYGEKLPAPTSEIPL